MRKDETHSVWCCIIKHSSRAGRVSVSGEGYAFKANIQRQTFESWSNRPAEFVTFNLKTLQFSDSLRTINSVTTQLATSKQYSRFNFN